MRRMLIGPVLVWMAALSLYDLRQRRLPNGLTIPGFVVIVVVAAATGRGMVAALGGAALAAVYVVAHLVSPAGMGAGDVKLALGLGALGACFGVDVFVLAALGGPLLTIGCATVARLVWSARTVPHGPSMCVATAAAIGWAAG